ncbi:MAG: flagellar regulator YcgR PilZN domain-containing protein, partial [Pseudomonadota bacterium]
MFQALKKFFLRRNAPPSSFEPEDEAAQRFTENPHFVTDPNQILKILRDLEKEELLFTVTLPHVAEKFSTTLLEVHGNRGYVVLDELTPETGHMWLLEKKQLTVHALVKGAPVSFKLNDIQTGRDQGIAYYTASVPRQVYYKERRHFRRVTMKID